MLRVKGPVCPTKPRTQAWAATSWGEIFSFSRFSFLPVRLARRSLTSTPGSASNKMPVAMIQGDGRWVKPSECEDRHPDPGLDWPHQRLRAALPAPGVGRGRGHHAQARLVNLRLAWTTWTVGVGGVRALRGPAGLSWHRALLSPRSRARSRDIHASH